MTYSNSEDKLIISQIKDVDDVLSHETTLKIFLYIQQQEEVGIRETQKKLSLKSPSTVSWHLDKLLEAGLIKKSASNNYHITEEGRNHKKLHIPIKIDAQILGGNLISNFLLLISFASVSLIINFILIFLYLDKIVSLEFVSLNLILSLIILTVILFIEYSKINNQVKALTKLDNK